MHKTRQQDKQNMAFAEIQKITYSIRSSSSYLLLSCNLLILYSVFLQFLVILFFLLQMYFSRITNLPSFVFVFLCSTDLVLSAFSSEGNNSNLPLHFYIAGNISLKNRGRPSPFSVR